MSGLFLELRDALIFVGIHYSEAARLLDRHIEHGDRRIRALILMEADHLRIIHLIYVVAREDKDILGVVSSYKVEVLVYRVRRALVPIRSALSLIRREMCIRDRKYPAPAILQSDFFAHFMLSE